MCRVCHRRYTRQHYQDNKQYYIDKAAKRTNEQRDKIREHLIACFAVGCSDCGTTDVRVLEFDHLGDKEYNISTMLGGGMNLDKVKAETAKCDVVCANCHKIRTAAQFNSWRNTRT